MLFLFYLMKYGHEIDLMTKLKTQMSGSISDNDEKTTHVTLKFSGFYLVSPMNKVR